MAAEGPRTRPAGADWSTAPAGPSLAHGERSRIVTGGQDVTSNELVRLADATRTLAEISTAAEAWDLVRTAEAARTYARMKGMGHDAINYATAIKAKAMVLLADLVDAGQEDGTIADRKTGRPKSMSDPHTSPVPLRDLLPDSTDPAHDVYEARRLREALGDADIDKLVDDANANREDFGIAGLRQHAARQRKPEPVIEPVPFPDGKFACIVADPPWSMRLIERRQRPDHGRHVAYPTMELDEIAKLPVGDLAADDCHLYLWVTHHFLPAGLTILEDWGFEYQCLMTWRKNVGITPFSWMYDTEHVLFARRGNLAMTQLGLRLSFDASVQGHSVKPDVFYERVTAASPGPRLEMFARRNRDGFTAWGNEVTDAG
jgi:N6-adenosine-specific RNA methylase IME4